MSAVLTIDLDAIGANWRLLRGRLAGVPCAAVVKADAYGLGLTRVAPALAAAGCDTFFVAQLQEGVALRALLPKATIGILAAPVAGFEADYAASRLLPVLNGLGDVEAWGRFARDRAAPPAILQLDTGMCRLGLSPAEVGAIASDPDLLAGIRPAWVMSHLACADEPEHPQNGEQLRRLRAALRQLPPPFATAPVTFANSSGIFLGPDWHFDLGRPGYALYGGNPLPGGPNPMRPVVGLEARILHVRTIDRRESVGYGASAAVEPGTRLATLAVGYADGWFRSFGGRGAVLVAGKPAPLVGRVSMDLIVIDVTQTEPQPRPGDTAVLIGPGRDIDVAADEAGTIGYELLTALGTRYVRAYAGTGGATRV
ncbi:MAG: alanine racemase [Alphaproteobacteria bacterium]